MERIFKRMKESEERNTQTNLASEVSQKESKSRKNITSSPI